MADEKKIATVAPAEKKTEKATEKKATPAKATAAKPAAKETPAKKTTAKKAPAKKAAPKKDTKKNALTLDTITTALWTKLEKADISKITDSVIAIQVVVENLGTFFIAIKDGEKHIIQAIYDDRDGTLECTTEALLQIAKGGFDYLASIKNGTINYQGDLRKALIIKDLF